MTNMDIYQQLYQEAFRNWQTIRAYNAGVMSDYITKRLEQKKHSIRIRAKMLVLGQVKMWDCGQSTGVSLHI